MQRNILIGNGINIEFGGKDNYSNSAIMRRMFTNIRNGKYRELLYPLSVDEHIELFEGLKNVLVNIGKHNPPETFLFLIMEIERIKKQYQIDTPIENIGMEDFFLALDYFIKPTDSNEFINQAHRGLQMPIIDSIFNDGKINNIDYGKNFKEYISSFDNVFTINYDSNLDRYVTNVHHLHGEFSKLTPEYDINSDYSIKNPEKCKAHDVIPDLSHVYSNTIMSWYWLEKYGEWIGKESEFGADAFKAMTGKLEIVGMSPCNDEHLFLTINQSGITSVDYYYHSDNGKNRMKDKIEKPITFKRADKLWQKLK